MTLSPGPAEKICSARSCDLPAEYAILWRNPKIPRQRHKTWLACPEHKEFLESYLGYRQFPLKVVSISEVDTAAF